MEEIQTENKNKGKNKKTRIIQIVAVVVALVATGVIFFFVGWDIGWTDGYQSAEYELGMAQTDNYDYNYDYDYNYSDDIYTSDTYAHSWTCDWCDAEWEGTAYYGSSVSTTLCAECANQYWHPFPISNYTKPVE